jgi:hypothetical protein
MELKKAQKKKVKLKIGMSGASGFGKTYSALLLAFGITDDWSKIAVIDTENRSASLYSDLGSFNTIELEAPFSPERYVEAVKTCEKAGIEVCIIDSITHEWDGPGGCLEIADLVTQASTSKNSYTACAKVTPRHKAFVTSILQTDMHVITTVRRKQDYGRVKKAKGRMEVQKVGTKEITREGFEYEVTINFEFQSANHLVTASKDRTLLFDKKDPFIITSETGKQLMEWANSGIDEVSALCAKIENAKSREELLKIWNDNKQLQGNSLIIESFRKIGKLYPETN